MTGFFGTILLGAGLLGCSPEHHEKKGREALDQHDLAEAEARYRKALSRDAEYVPALWGLGWTYRLAGRPDAARSSFARCAEVDPTEPECLRGLASVATSEGNPTEARALLQDALSLDPDHPGVLSSLALQEVAAGDLDPAAARYEDLMARFPETGEYRMGLAEVRLRQKRPTDALELVDSALEQEGTPPRYKGMLLQLKARALVAATANRIDHRDCAQTAPPVLEWLQAAANALDEAEATGVPLPDLPAARRLVVRRRAAVEDRCSQEDISGEPPPEEPQAPQPIVVVPQPENRD